MFLDDSGSVSIARYDEVKYPQFEVLTTKQLGFFWRPEEVNLTKDKKDFQDLSPHEQHIFTANLKRQIILDSVQGRAPVIAFGPIISLPEIEVWNQTWTFSETIHSRSYTHIIKNVYPNPSLVFDEMLNIQEIVDCATDISKYYDDLIRLNNLREVKAQTEASILAHKKALWLAINAVNALEGVRFYVSFACSWAFGELKTMEGNAKIIKLICRDENLHLSGTQKMLDLLPKEDKDFLQIKKESEKEVLQMFKDVIAQEKQWAKYLFKDGSMIGLNADILCQYVDWIAFKRMKAIGLQPDFKISSANPLPWTQSWISGADVQVAPQETEITSYVIGGINNDIDDETFSGFEL